MSAGPNGQRVAYVECNRKPLGVSAPDNVSDVQSGEVGLLIVRSFDGSTPSEANRQPAKNTHCQEVDRQKQKECRHNAEIGSWKAGRLQELPESIRRGKKPRMRIEAEPSRRYQPRSHVQHADQKREDGDCIEQSCQPMACRIWLLGFHAVSLKAMPFVLLSTCSRRHCSFFA